MSRVTCSGEHTRCILFHKAWTNAYSVPPPGSCHVYKEVTDSTHIVLLRVLAALHATLGS